MRRRLTPWQMVLVGSLVFVVAGTLAYCLTDELQTLGFYVFVAAAVLLVVARIMVMREGRSR